MDVWGADSNPLHKWTTEIVVQTLPKQKLELCAVVLRNIWKMRNEFIFENKFVHPNEVNLSTSKVMEDIYKVQIITSWLVWSGPFGRIYMVFTFLFYEYYFSFFYYNDSHP